MCHNKVKEIEMNASIYRLGSQTLNENLKYNHRGKIVQKYEKQSRLRVADQRKSGGRLIKVMVLKTEIGKE